MCERLVNRDCLKYAIMPQAIIDFLHDQFKTYTATKEVAFLVLHNMYGDAHKDYVLPHKFFKDLGYHSQAIQDAFDILCDSGLIERTREPSKFHHIAGEYRYVLPVLFELLKGNMDIRRGIKGKKPRRIISTQNSELKNALYDIGLPWNNENAMDYISTLPAHLQYKTFNTIKLMHNGFIKTNWKESRSGNVRDGLRKLDSVISGKRSYN